MRFHAERGDGKSSNLVINSKNRNRKNRKPGGMKKYEKKIYYGIIFNHGVIDNVGYRVR